MTGQVKNIFGQFRNMSINRSSKEHGMSNKEHVMSSGTCQVNTMGPNGHFRDIGQISKIHKKSIKCAY